MAKSYLVPNFECFLIFNVLEFLSIMFLSFSICTIFFYSRDFVSILNVLAF